MFVSLRLGSYGPRNVTKCGVLQKCGKIFRKNVLSFMEIRTPTTYNQAYKVCQRVWTVSI